MINEFIKLTFDKAKAKEYQKVLDAHGIKFNLVKKLEDIVNDYHKDSININEAYEEIEGLCIEVEDCPRIYNKKYVDGCEGLIFFGDSTILMPNEDVEDNQIEFGDDYVEYHTPADLDAKLTHIEEKVKLVELQSKDPEIKKLKKKIAAAEKRKKDAIDLIDVEIDKYKQQIKKLTAINKDF